MIKELVDFDYIHLLSEKELEFLNNFVKENYSADFRDAKLITDQDERRRIYRENNARNRDVFAVTKIMGRLNYGEVQYSMNTRIHNSDDDLNSLYDLNNRKRKARKAAKK